ncbi:hypothetical protein ACFQ3C_08545 [Seohaeicola saemankumensis]|uniref:Uncharacterized protein n=1 Tax=Seohaeicola saemankumensis TaxID=481181 RepID=A0ABW3TC97_9RHOB
MVILKVTPEIARRARLAGLFYLVIIVADLGAVSIQRNTRFTGLQYQDDVGILEADAIRDLMLGQFRFLDGVCEHYRC